MTESSNIFHSGSLTHAAALSLIGHAVAAAAERTAAVAISVADASGQIIASLRMDGAPELAMRVARKKAWTSAQTGAPSGDVLNFISGDRGSSISMPHIEDFCVIAGGLPVASGETRLGGFGVSGGSPEFDLEIARHALAAFMAAA